MQSEMLGLAIHPIMAKKEGPGRVPGLLGGCEGLMNVRTGPHDCMNFNNAETVPNQPYGILLNLRN
jgi:hypothetical protein